MPTFHLNTASGLDSPFLPSQVVKLADQTPVDVRYAVDWVLDHGEDLSPEHVKRVHDNFKWRADAHSRAFRKGFLRQVLVHALEMESAHDGGTTPRPVVVMKI